MDLNLIDFFLKEGLKHFKRAELEDAVSYWRKALKIDPTNDLAKEYLCSLGLDDQPSTNKVEKLIKRGLCYYGEGDYSAAAEQWVEALKLDSSNQEARDYLATVDEENLPGTLSDCGLADSPESDCIDEEILATGPRVDDKKERQNFQAKVVSLLSEKRYEEVYELLSKRLKRRPDDATYKRSLELVENKLILGYASKIGSTHEILRSIVGPQELREKKLNYEMAYLLGMFDGVMSIEDVLDVSALGRFKTYRYIIDLQELSLIAGS